MPDLPNPHTYYYQDSEFEGAFDGEKCRNNFWYIFNKMVTTYGWTPYSAACACGSFSMESWFNPSAYQGYPPEIPSNPKLGYGIIQWTPATIILNWMAANGYSRNDLDAEIYYLCGVEMEAWLTHNYDLQAWYNTSNYPIGYDTYTATTENDGHDIDWMVDAFFYNRLRGGATAITTIPQRKANAKILWELVSGGSVTPPDPPDPPEPVEKKKSKIWLYMRPWWAERRG